MALTMSRTVLARDGNPGRKNESIGNSTIYFYLNLHDAKKLAIHTCASAGRQIPKLEAPGNVPSYARFRELPSSPPEEA